MSTISIADSLIGSEAPVFVIAELSANHNQDIQIALDTISAARDCGANAVKFQTYTADTITIDCSNKYFQIDKGTLWDGKTLYQLYKEAYTPWHWHEQLFSHARDCGLIAFSSPFDPSAVDFLNQLNAPAFKVASFEITDIPLISYIASQGKPVIISTGIATIDEISQALEACYQQGNRQIALLKCTSAYPTPYSEVNLRTMTDLRQRFEVLVGLSDHTVGITVPVMAVALGAQIIEKHLIISRSLGGPDAEFSLEPAEFKEMVTRVREAEQALGSITYELSARVARSREFCRSLFVVSDVAQGEILTEKNVRSIRPGFGLAPKHTAEILGKRATRKLERGTPLAWDMFE
jgi:pseudaminic acid synthase